jgi:hypothetical protein
MRITVSSFLFRRSLHRLVNRIGPGRMRSLVTLLAVFTFFNFCVRLGLAVYNGDPDLFAPWRLVPALLVGAVFDIGAVSFALAPLAWLLALWPGRKSAHLIRLFSLITLPLCLLMGLIASLEFVFWHDHAARFHTAAIDYLRYPAESLAQVRQQPVLLTWLLVGTLLGGTLLWRTLMQLIAPRLGARRASKSERRLAAALWTALPLITFVGLDVHYKEISHRPQLNELAGNGYFELAHALRGDQTEFVQLYKALPRETMLSRLASELSGSHRQGGPTFAADSRLQKVLERDVVPQAGSVEQLRHVVLITLDGIGADRVGALGKTPSLTPHLDSLAEDSLLFTRLYATSRSGPAGQVSLTLSVPPSPGRVPLPRTRSEGLGSLGDVFRSKGYDVLYLQGEAGHLDNMADFFAANGYSVIDPSVPVVSALSHRSLPHTLRSDLPDEQIYARVLTELDHSHTLGRKCFAQVMLRSNHSPYEYPEGRIDLPPRSGPVGALRYSDWALGEFMNRARQQPWFNQTIFVLVSDHAGGVAARQPGMNLDDFHIPLLIHAPGLITPRRVDTVASQMDVGPTVLGLMNISYRSRFFGQDILREGRHHQRALLSDDRSVGYYEDGLVVELQPRARYRVVDVASRRPLPTNDLRTDELLADAVSYYQTAAEAYRSGLLRNSPR